MPGHFESTSSNSTLGKPIPIDGHTSFEEAKESLLILSRTNLSPRTKAFMLIQMTLITALSVYSLGRKTSMAMIAVFAVCVLAWTLTILKRILTFRNLTSLRKQHSFEKVVHGDVTSDTITIKTEWPMSQPLETRLAWNDVQHVRFGESVVLLCAPTEENPNRPNYHLVGRSLFRTEADWLRFRQYAGLRAPEWKPATTETPTPEEQAQAACARCLKIFDKEDLGHVPIWLRWVYPPLWMPTRRNRYCPRCKRSMSSALFFIVFMIFFVGGMLIFLPKKPR